MTSKIQTPELESLCDDLYTLAILWGESSESPDVERCRYFVGWEMAERVKRLYKLFHGTEDKDQKVLSLAA